MHKFVSVLLFGCLSSCAFAQSTEYTLYRTGVDVPSQKHDESLRIHVATFNASPLSNTEENAKYNLANCDFAQELFNQNQPHYRSTTLSKIKVKYWCEKGGYRK